MESLTSPKLLYLRDSRSLVGAIPNLCQFQDLIPRQDFRVRERAKNYDPYWAGIESGTASFGVHKATSDIFTASFDMLAKIYGSLKKAKVVHHL